MPSTPRQSPTGGPPPNATPVLIICGTVVLLACLGGALYMANTTANQYAAFGLMSLIVASVLAGTFGLTKLNRIADQVEVVAKQTNGELDARIREAIRAVLDERETMGG